MYRRSKKEGFGPWVSSNTRIGTPIAQSLTLIFDQGYCQIVVFLLFAAQSRIFGVGASFAFRCRWSFIVNLMIEIVCHGIVAHVVCVVQIVFHVLRNRASNFDWYIANDLCEMADFFFPNSSIKWNRGIYQQPIWCRGNGLWILTDWVKSGMIWCNRVSCWHVQSTMLGSGSQSLGSHLDSHRQRS